jgi:hypothetical protein
MGAEPMDEDPSNEVFVLSLLEGYGADEAEAMDTEPVPCAEDWRDKYIAWMDRGELPSNRSEARRIPRMAKSTASCTSVPRRASCSGAYPFPGARTPSIHSHGHVWPPRGAAHPRGQHIPLVLLLAHRGC